MQSIWQEIVGKLRVFVHDAGFKKVVVGGSGGLDSSVVVCLAVAAVGKENVLVAMMPSPHSSEGSLTDTIFLCIEWDVLSVTIPITESMASFDSALSPLKSMVRSFSGPPKSERTFTKENIQARIRMTLLMAISNEYNCLVLNTCNRSEDYTGYCTLYGDSGGAIAPIGDLYKTEVYDLAGWINDNPELPNIPLEIIGKLPSAELSDGQLDTDSLPPYEILDPILRHRLDEGLTEASIVALGHAPETVAQAVSLINGSAYKRAQSAPVLKLDRKS